MPGYAKALAISSGCDIIIMLICNSLYYSEDYSQDHSQNEQWNNSWNDTLLLGVNTLLEYYNATD